MFKLVQEEAATNHEKRKEKELIINQIREELTDKTSGNDSVLLYYQKLSIEQLEKIVKIINE